MAFAIRLTHYEHTGTIMNHPGAAQQTLTDRLLARWNRVVYVGVSVLTTRGASLSFVLSLHDWPVLGRLGPSALLPAGARPGL